MPRESCANNFVLDVGSGHKPNAQATHLCDLYFEDTERGAHLVIDRPFVNCSLEYLPFRASSFEFVYACHVLEHVNDPNLAFSELLRVANGGYIECPSFLTERVYGWPFHKRSICCEDGKIKCRRKPSTQKIIDMHKVYRTNFVIKITHNVLDVLFGCLYMRICWTKNGTLIKISSLSLKQRLTLLMGRSF